MKYRNKITISSSVAILCALFGFYHFGQLRTDLNKTDPKITATSFFANKYKNTNLKTETDSNQHFVDTAVSLLKSGFIVLRMGRGVDSYILSQMNEKDKSFSHCGIVFIENGYPFIYHCIGGENNPDERMRRDSAISFFSPTINVGIAVIKYDFNDSQIIKVHLAVNQLYKSKPKFDLKFDLNTNSELYCSEMVYKAVNSAMNDSNYIKSTIKYGKTYVGIDNLFMNKHAKMVWQVNFK